MESNKELLKKIKELEKAGFKVQKVVKTTKKTFEVPEKTIFEFMSIVKSIDGLKVKDAIDQALTDWIKKNR